MDKIGKADTLSGCRRRWGKSVTHSISWITALLATSCQYGRKVLRWRGLQVVCTPSGQVRICPVRYRRCWRAHWACLRRQAG